MSVTGPVLLISPDGMLGQAWSTLLTRDGVPHVGASFPALDLTSAASLDAIDFSGFSVVVNCSGYTDVDGAESNEAQATAVNGHGVGALAQRCAVAGAVLVHYSTDYVFDGLGEVPYCVDHPRAPLNAYGRSKAIGEVLIEEAGDAHLIVRTSWLYAPWGNNFVRTMARLGRQRDSLRVVDDQHGRPTSAEHLAAVTMALLDHDTRGIAHVTDGGQCTWHGLAQAVIAAVNPDCRVERCSTAEFPRPATRPPYSVLDLSATEAVVGPMRLWTDNVADVMSRLPSDSP